MAKWVTNWGIEESPALMREQMYAKNVTLRYVMPVSIDGSKVTFTFSNRYTDEPVTISCASVGRTTLKSSTTTEICPLTFGGKREVTVPAGESVTTDALSYVVSKGEMLNVTMYFGDFAKLSTGITIMGPYSYGFMCEGNYVDESVFPLYVERDTFSHYMICGMDVYADSDDAYAIVAFGDSITAQSWVDQVTERLLDPDGCAFDKQIAMVRKAISGSRVLREYRNWLNIHYGDGGIKRIERALDTVKGAKALMFMHGVNDLIHPGAHPIYRPMSDLPTAQELQTGLLFYITEAKKRGLSVYASPITPFGRWHSYTPDRNEIRLAVNEWIRSSTEIDKVVDFAALTQEEGNENCMQASGTDDGLHPSYGMAGKMAQLFFDEIIR